MEMGRSFELKPNVVTEQYVLKKEQHSTPPPLVGTNFANFVFNNIEDVVFLKVALSISYDCPPFSFNALRITAKPGMNPEGSWTDFLWRILRDMPGMSVNL